MVDTLLPEPAEPAEPEQPEQPGQPGQPEPIRQPPLGPAGWLRWAWRQLTSMRTALLLLLLLAVAAVPGSVFPQRRIDAGRVLTYLDEHPASGVWLDRLGAFDVYTSVWFSAVYLLLFVSLVGCVVPRTRQHWRTLRSSPPRTPRRLDRLPAHASAVLVGVPAGPGAARDVLAAARTALRRSRFRLAEHDETGGASIAAERGHAAETGNLVFHLGLLGLLVSVGAGSFLGYSGQVVLVEGGTFANVTAAYDSFQAGSRVAPGDLAPFTMRLDALRVTFDDTAAGNQFGAPRSFDGRLTVTDEPGARPRAVDLAVNAPLDVRGTRVFLVGNGYAPVITVRDGAGDEAFGGPVPFLAQDANYTSLGVVKVPDARPRQLGLQGVFLPTAVLDPRRGPISIFPAATDPRLVLTAWASRPGADGLRLDTGEPQSVYVLDTRDMTQLTTSAADPFRALLAPGATVSLPDGAGTVTFEGLRRYAALDVRYDPAKTFVLGFGLLALAGLTASLFVRRRRLWVRVSADEQGRTVVAVAGLARGDDVGLAPLVAELLDDIVKSATPKE